MTQDMRAHLVFAFYHVLTWYLSPAAFQRVGISVSKVQAYVAGFVASLALYQTVGKTYIYK